jgi:hypothetical protein
VRAVEPREHGADLRADATDHRLRERFEHGDVVVLRTRGRSDLGADEPCADHAQPVSPFERSLDALGVLDGAEREHAVEVGLTRQPPRVRAGGDDQAVVLDDLVADDDRAAVDIERAGGGTEPQIDIEHVQGLGPQLDRTTILGAGEELLRQRGPVVGGMALGADQGQVALVAVPAECLHGTQSGQRTTDDDDLLHRIRGGW